MSIEDLLRLQEAHEGMERQKQEEENQRAAEKAEAQAYLDKRVEIIEQITLLQKEIERMGGREMEERIAASEELKALEEEKASELEEIKAGMDEMQSYLDAVQEIIARSESTGMGAAPEVIRALSDAQAVLDELMQGAPALIAEIALLQSRQISPEQVREYQWIRDELAHLTLFLGEIEQHPLMREYSAKTPPGAEPSEVHRVPIFLQVGADEPGQEVSEPFASELSETVSYAKEPSIPRIDLNEGYGEPPHEEHAPSASADQLANERIRLRQALTDIETEMEKAGFFALDRKRRLHEDMERHRRDLQLVEGLLTANVESRKVLTACPSVAPQERRREGQVLKETSEATEQANTAIF